MGIGINKFIVTCIIMYAILSDSILNAVQYYSSLSIIFCEPFTIVCMMEPVYLGLVSSVCYFARFYFEQFPFDSLSITSVGNLLL